MIKISKAFKSEKGAALAWSLIMFLMVTILLSSIIFVAAQNTRETTLQNQKLRTYYMALSGVDLGYAAMMTQKGTDLYIREVIANNSTITKTFEIKDGTTDVGRVDVVVSIVSDASSRKWVQIKSTAVLLGTPTTVVTVMRIDTLNFQNIVRETTGL